LLKKAEQGAAGQVAEMRAVGNMLRKKKLNKEQLDKLLKLEQ